MTANRRGPQVRKLFPKACEAGAESESLRVGADHLGTGRPLDVLLAKKQSKGVQQHSTTAAVEAGRPTTSLQCTH